jgi:hypothetical protein
MRFAEVIGFVTRAFALSRARNTSQSISWEIPVLSARLITQGTRTDLSGHLLAAVAFPEARLVGDLAMELGAPYPLHQLAGHDPVH